MSANKANNGKKRQAPLPEEIYPDLAAKETSDLVNDTGSTSTERLPRTLPLGEPVFSRRNQLLESDPSARYSWAPESGVARLLPKRRSLGDINFPLDINEVLDVQRLSENVKALENTEYHNGQRKRHSSGDVSKYLHKSSSKSSLQSNGLSERSFSLNSLSSSYGTDNFDTQMDDQEDILTLTAHVRDFSDALSKLRNAFPGDGSDTDSDENIDGGNAGEEMLVKAHKCLAKVLSNLKEVINRYRSLNSNEILAAAGDLISKVRNLNDVYSKNPQDFYQAIDQLALVFGSSISDLLMGDHQELGPNKAGDDVDDVDDFPDDDDYTSEADPLSQSMNMSSRQEPCNDILRDKNADLDRVLLKMESGVDFCLQWTKYWSKYVKDIANYIEKRAQLEAEYTKQLTKLAQATRTSISEENYLPFQSTFFTALDQDIEYAQKCQQTLSAICGPRFMEPLMQRRSVHDRARKTMKDEWTKTCRQLHDSANSVKTSKNNYHKKKQELEKLNARQSDVKESKEDGFSVFSSNKGKKEEELRSKVDELEQFYNQDIDSANEMQNEAEKTKVRIVAQTKQLVEECDRTFRSVTRKYFDMMHELAVPTPIHFKTLADSCQGYDPGKEFEDFVRFQQSTARCAVPRFYKFQPYPGTLRPGNDPESPARNGNYPGGHISDCEGGASPTGSPPPSPKIGKKPPTTGTHPPPSTDDESEGDSIRKKGSKNKPGRRAGKPSKMPKGLTKEAASHTFHKIRAPAKCSECDRYVFNGVECAQCGLSCHNRKCLENLQTPCSHSRRLPSPMKLMKTFGVRFSEDGGVPVLVTKCVKEINRRGLRVKGIYRVSGVKSKMESLCQEFETNAESVDLSTQPPHLIASVLKLYIRQLPEPLMTTKLYSDLIILAKESTHLNWLSIDQYEDENKQEFKKLLENLKVTIKKLPRSNYLTTATLIKHLHKVAMNEEHNQMNPQNLAIVFGPTILRLECENSTTSLSSLVDMSHQTRIVALLIVNPQVFDDVPDEPELVRENVSNEENDSSLPSTPVETFNLTKSEEEENGMPALYGERSTRVRGEGLSPMDQLASQSSDGKDNIRSNSNTMRINERFDIKGEATSVFDETSISLPGSLEERNRYLELPQEDEMFSSVGMDTDRLGHNLKQNQHSEVYNSKSKDGEIIENSNDNGSIKFSKDNSLTEEIQDEFNKKLSRVHVDANKAEQIPSSSESNGDDDMSIPRRRSTAFSVGRRNTNPDMLAKRGSALINAYMGDCSVKTGDSESSLKKNSVVSTNDSKQENDIGANSESVPLLSTSANETTDSDITPVNTESEDQDHRERSGTLEVTSPVVSKSGDESNISTLYRETPSRKRSATYESDRRRMIENRQERLEKQLANDRLLMYGTRRTRVSVKDQIKQLENREQNDSSKGGTLGLRNNKPQTTVTTSANTFGYKATSDTQGRPADIQANENGHTFNSIDGKENVNGNAESNSSSQVKSHEKLTRLFVASDNSGIFQPPKSPVPKYRTVDDKFCALKMDISLESSRIPLSSSSGDDESDNTDVTRLLPTWKGRGLTPRDSSQAPEFV